MRSQRARRLLARLASLRAQLIVPYVLLTVLTALVGIFVVTRLVTASVRERFVNQLYEASRVASDAVVRRERSHLEALRLMAFTEGVPAALEANDADKLEELLWPLAVNEGVEITMAADLQGREVVSLIRKNQTTYVATSGSDLSSIVPIRRTLAEEQDERGDKFVGVISTAFGDFLVTSAPVRDADGNLMGSLLVGTRLTTLAEELKAHALADVAIFDASGDLLASTLAEDDGPQMVLRLADFEQVRQAPALRDLRLAGRPYQALYSSWVVRGEELGTLVTVLPSNFIVSTEATSRDLFSLVFSLATLLVIVLGYNIAQNIAKPLLRLRGMAQAVAAGDLNQRSDVQREDEIGDLAQAFDTMTLRLQERTEEAQRLYAEAVERNRELTRMYEQLRQAQQQLVQSEKLASVGQLAAGIVHDVKNPLGVIKGMAEELMEEIDELSAREETAELATGLQVIRDSASRANQIVTDLLKFARQSPPTLEPHDLRETVEGVLRLTRYMLRKGKVEAHLDAPHESVIAVYDLQQIEQVLINLIQNAVQAMPDGGDLYLSLDVEGDSVVLRLRDTGTGIAPEHISRIFDPFFTTKAEGQGVGLGLSVSYGIIARHGGRIEVESEQGKGATFTVILPREAPQTEQQQELLR